MALINCPECGKENVSDTAISCPACGYNIQQHMKRKLQQEKAHEREVKYQQEEQRRIEKMNDPAYKKKMLQMAITVCVILAIIICAFVFVSKYQTAKAYEKDLSSVFGFSLDVSMDDIIQFEAEKYGNTEYNTDRIQDGEMIRLEFAPYSVSDTETRYRHYYFFYTDTGLLDEVDYHDVISAMIKDKEADCNHISDIKANALKISYKWDKKENDGLFLTMYGNIDGIKCRVRYQSGSAKAISLFIDRVDE